MKGFFVFLIFAMIIVCALAMMWIENKPFRTFIKEHITDIFKEWFMEKDGDDE